MYLIRRFASLLLTLWIAISIIFGLFRMLPGDPATALLGPLARAEERAQLSKELGLDTPILKQYGVYLTNLAQGDLGTSFSERRPVIDIVLPAFVNTFILVLFTFVIAYGIGLILGVVLAWYRGTRGEAVGVFLTLTLRGAPSFWLAIMAVTIFAIRLRWLPAAGLGEVDNFGASALKTYLSLDFLKHLILPVGVSVIGAVGVPLLLVRSAMLDVIGTQYMELAEAKGLTQRRVMFSHGARNALLPLVEASGQFIGWSMGAMVVIENVFSWPGLGQTIVAALETRDYQLAQGALVLIALTVMALNLLADIVSASLDPRIKLG